MAENWPTTYEHNGVLVTSTEMQLLSSQFRALEAGQQPTPAELQQYLFDCSSRGVHPLSRLIYFTKRKGKYTPVTSIDFMRIRAESTGAYAGSDDIVFEEKSGKPTKATATVWKMIEGQRCSFSASARWAEYHVEGNAGYMWTKMPNTMLGKCAEALALRKGFPGQLSGLYAKEEMDQADADNGSGAGNAPPPKTAPTSTLPKATPPKPPAPPVKPPEATYPKTDWSAMTDDERFGYLTHRLETETWDAPRLAKMEEFVSKHKADMKAEHFDAVVKAWQAKKDALVEAGRCVETTSATATPESRCNI